MSPQIPYLQAGKPISFQILAIKFLLLEGSMGVTMTSFGALLCTNQGTDNQGAGKMRLAGSLNCPEAQSAVRSHMLALPAEGKVPTKISVPFSPPFFFFLPSSPLPLKPFYSFSIFDFHCNFSVILYAGLRHGMITKDIYPETMTPFYLAFGPMFLLIRTFHELSEDLSYIFFYAK